MQRAGAADNQEAVGFAHDDLDSIFAALDHGVEGGLGEGDLGEQQLRGDQGILAQDYADAAASEYILYIYLCGLEELVEGIILRVSSTTTGSISRAGIKATEAEAKNTVL